MSKDKARKQRKSFEPLEAIKRLLVLDVVLNGASSKDIAKALGIGERRVQQMVFMKRVMKKK